MKKFIILITLVILLASCKTTSQKGKQPVRVKFPEVPELPDLPKGLDNEDYKSLFLYMIDVNSAYEEVLLTLQSGIEFTDESIKEELEFTRANLDAIKESLGEPLDDI